jgi:hypothetical protein
MSDFNISPQERQRLVSMYVTQYNQTNAHITRLFNTLDDIRNNINNLIGNNMGRNNQANRSSVRPNRNNRQHHLNPFVNTNSGRGPFIHYDYNNPIERSTYITEFMNDIITNNTTNIRRHENNPHITDFLTTFLNSTVPIRPTQEQINNASRLVRFDSIQSPNSTSCAISLEPFSSDDTVRQLHHCGHIFFPDQFNQWFRNNVRCPVCRHDIRSTTATTSSTSTSTSTSTTIPYTTSTTTETTPTSISNLNPVTNLVDQLTIDISNNEISDNLLSSIASRFLTNLLNPSTNTSANSTTNARTNNDRIIYDPTTDSLIFETIIRSNNNQT